MNAAIPIPVGKGHSFFSFIKNYCFSEIKSINRSIHRLCSLMRKMGVETAAIEDIDTTFPEISEECAALNIRHDGSAIEIKAFQITFINEKIGSVEKIREINDSQFLASVIIINFKNNNEWNSYLFRAIVTIPGITKETDRMPLLNNYIHVFKTFPCEIRISDTQVHKFNIIGTYFSQQNSTTSVCGHAALCMAVNNTITFSGEFVSPEHINRSIGVDHKNRKFGPGTGLSIEDIRKALDSFGLEYAQMAFFEYPNFEYNEIVYRYLESGYPVLLIFTTKDELHVVTVIGHTLNSDLWRPEAEFAYTKPVFATEDHIAYRSAAAWVDHFIIHDDNFGMYLCMPVESLKRITLPMHDPAFRACFAVMVIAPGVTTPAYEAEYASVKVSKDILLRHKNSKAGAINDWLRLILLTDELKLASVVRTMLINKEDYARNLEYIDFEGKGFTDNEKAELIKDLPDFFWLSEITLPDLYTANKTKIIDFFYPSNLPPWKDVNDIFGRWLQVRFPEALLKNTASGLSVYDMSVSSHYPLFRLNKEQKTSEW